MNALGNENWAYWRLVLLLLLAMIFSEWRTISFHMWGERRFSPVDMVFFFGLGWFYYTAVRGERWLSPLKQVASLWYLLLPIAGMLLFYSDRSALSNTPPSFSRYALLGLTAYMLATAFLLRDVSRDRLLEYLLGFVQAVLIFYIVVYIFTRYIYWKPFIYGEGTPETGWTTALNFPFGSPSQAGLFIMLNLMLGVGAALALRRYLLLYLMIPVLVLCIFQTGSRSIAVLLAVATVGLYALLLLRNWIMKAHAMRELLHLLLSSILAVLLLFFTLDAQGERALSLFGYSPMQMVFGEVDCYRAEAWRQAYEWAVFGGGAMPAEGGSNGGSYGLHNAYLDLWLNWGELPAVSFVIFLLVLLGFAGRLLWRNRNEAHYPIYAALVTGVGAVIGAIYANPLLHLKYIWVFFGLVVSLQFIGPRDSKSVW